MSTPEESEMDNIIFGKDNSNEMIPSPTVIPLENSAENSPVSPKAKSMVHPPPAMDDEEGGRQRSSSSQLFSMDKIKNGASNAGKLFGSTFSFVKQKSSAGWEQAKGSTPGTSISAGWQKAVAASSESMGKLKENEAYKKTSTIASAGWGKTSEIASAGWEKTKQGATVAKGNIAPTLELAKQGASAGLEKAKVLDSNLVYLVYGLHRQELLLPRKILGPPWKKPRKALLLDSKKQKLVQLVALMLSLTRRKNKQLYYKVYLCCPSFSSFSLGFDSSCTPTVPFGFLLFLKVPAAIS